MASNRKNFFGIGLVASASTTNSTPGDTEYLSSDGKFHGYGASSNDAIVMEALAATLTNKSISGATNTLTAIPNSALTNSGITINGSSVSLGGTITVTATATNTLTLGTGLTGTSYNGSTAITAAIDTSVVATLTGTQTLTNKTLTSPTITGQSANTISGIAGSLALSATLVSINNITFGTNTISDSSGGVIIQSNNASNGVTLNGTSSGYVTFQKDATQVAFVNTGAITLVNQNALQLRDSSTNYVALKAPATVTTYTITLPAAAPASNTALVYNGTNYVWSQAGGWTTGTATSLVGGGAISISTTAGQQLFVVAGNAGAVTLSGTAFGASAPIDGAVVRAVCNSNTNTVTFVNSDTSRGTIINGAATLYKYNVIEFQYSSTLDRWTESFRNF